MKHYKDNFKLYLLNIILEFGLLAGTYFGIGYIRSLIVEPVGKYFVFETAAVYAPYAVIVCICMVVMYLLLGDYYFIHFNRKRKLWIEVFIVSCIGAVLIASLMFLIQNDRLSGIFLVMLVMGWTLVIGIKRIALSDAANVLFKDKLENYRILVIGDNDNTARYLKEIKSKAECGYICVGYLAKHSPGDEAQETAAQSSTKHGEMGFPCVGQYENLGDVIKNLSVNRVVITEENLTRKFLSAVLSVCSAYGIGVRIIPAYSDFIAGKQRIKEEDGLCFIEVNVNNKSNILGVGISVTNMEKTMQDIKDNLEDWRGEYICVSNVHTTVMAHDDAEYRSIQNGAVMALPDGGPLSSYSRSEGREDARRVTGPDLMKEILKESKDYGWRHFFYGSSQKTLDLLRDKITDTYPGAVIAGMISPPFREITPEEDEEYIEKINEAKPDFVWVGLGAPKQEIWMAAHKHKINAIMIGVGAAFDYESGNLKRAPKWMQKCSLEWLYRLLQEPRRLFKRYLVTNIKFLWLTRR